MDSKSMKTVAAFIVILCIGCGDFLPKINTGYTFGDDVSGSKPEDSHARPLDAGREVGDAGVTDEDIELEELEMEDPGELSALISQKLATMEKEERSRTKDQQKRASLTDPEVRAPSAYWNWKLSKEQCFEQLKKEKVRFRQPEFATPMVGAPLLLDGPIDGVDIRPRWPQSSMVNAVMDCHLVLALVEVSRQAKDLGIRQILYYSSYRPLKTPPKECKRGRAGAKCRKRQKAYKKARKNPSQHRRALAIDIRWLVTEQGETLDVLEHFDRRRRRPPCDYTASTREGRLLQEFACRLHREQIFNVMLTPNANKAHHNHFHFDITPNVKWYIIR